MPDRIAERIDRLLRALKISGFPGLIPRLGNSFTIKK